MKKKIVVVDDDRSIFELLAAHLGKSFEMIPVYNGEHAVLVIEREMPALVLLDILMPELSGLDILSNLATRGSKIPVIMLTSDEDMDSVEKALSMGASEYITKPFNVRHLCETITTRLLGEDTPHCGDDSRPWRVKE